MENLEGILIATTNLADNMDSAFERRFLYKVEFKNPDEDVRQNIWKTLVKGISDEDAMTLAKKYSFSGGEIENISRKSTVEFILTGEHPNLATLEEFCGQEKYNKKTVRPVLGFTA